MHNWCRASEGHTFAFGRRPSINQLRLLFSRTSIRRIRCSNQSSGSSQASLRRAILLFRERRGIGTEWASRDATQEFDRRVDGRWRGFVRERE